MEENSTANQWNIPLLFHCGKGRVTMPKWMNFRESSKQSLTPSPLIIVLQCLFVKVYQKALFKGPKPAT